MLRRLLTATIAAMALIAGSVMAMTTPASAANGVWCDPQTTV